MKQNKVIQAILVLMTILFLSVVTGVSAQATEGAYNVNPITGLPVNETAPSTPTAPTTDGGVKDSITNLEPNQLPNVTTDEVTNWAERKGYEVVNFLQKFGKPFFIVCFLFGLLQLIFASITGGKKGGGIATMIICLIGWVVTIYAPEIFLSFEGWATGFNYPLIR